MTELLRQTFQLQEHVHAAEDTSQESKIFRSLWHTERAKPDGVAKYERRFDSALAKFKRTSTETHAENMTLSVSIPLRVNATKKKKKIRVVFEKL